MLWLYQENDVFSHKKGAKHILLSSISILFVLYAMYKVIKDTLLAYKLCVQGHIMYSNKCTHFNDTLLAYKFVEFISR